MGDKVFEQVTEYIDAMAAKLGVASEYVFELLIRQQYISGTVGVAVGVLFLVITVAITYFTVNAYLKGKSEERVKVGYNFISEEVPVNAYGKVREQLDEGWIVAVIFVVFVTFVIGTVEIVVGVKTLLNPEYYAIKEILDVFKGAK